MRAQPIRVAIDLETTGLVAEQDSIIEIGALKFAGDEVIDTFESYVAYRAAVPYRVRRLTGISASDLADAPKLADLAGPLDAFLGDAPLVGHSVQFDAAFLRRVGLARRNPLVDTYELASALLPNLVSYTLESVGTALGLVSSVYHRALADAVLSKDVFLALLARMEALDPATLRMLGRLTTGQDWTPAYFVRSTMRAQGIAPNESTSAAGTVGSQMFAQLGIDAAVLGLAVAQQTDAGIALPVMRGTRAEAPTIADPVGVPASEPVALQSTPPDVEATPPDGLDAALSALSACALDGGTTLVDLELDDERLARSLEPFVRWVAETGRQALVVAADASAATRLAQTHLPRVLTRLELAAASLPVALVSDRASYLCLHRWFGAATSPRDGMLPRDIARGMAKLAVWVRQTQTGTRAEVALAGPELTAWERTRSGPEYADSMGECAYRARGYCFVARAEQAARTARLVVTTHAALARMLADRDHLLPEAERVLIFDAHLLEDALREACGWTLERAALGTLLADLGRGDPGGQRSGLLHLAAERLPDAPEAAWVSQVVKAQKAADSFFASLGRLYVDGQQSTGKSGQGDGSDQALLMDERARRLPDWPEAQSAWVALRSRLDAVGKLCAETTNRALSGAGRARAVSSDGVATDLLGARRAITEVCARGDTVFAEHGARGVVWLRQPPVPGPRREQAPRRPEQAASAPVHPEPPVLHSGLADVRDVLAPLVASGRGLALMGPALAAGGDFEYIVGALGIGTAEPRTLAVLPDHRAQSLLLLPEDAVEPNAASYQRNLDETLIALGTRLRGRLLAIFPSHAALRAAYAGIKATLEARDVLVLAQGQDGSVRQLWQNFNTQPRVVLLGAGAFWEGVEVEGRAPVCIVVTRIPFPSLSDPLLAARADAWHDQQNQFVVPHAALRLRHALTGLAWSHPTRNAVVLFDRRLTTRGYGPALLGALPRCTVRNEPLTRLADEVALWVDGEASAERDGTPS